MRIASDTPSDWDDASGGKDAGEPRLVVDVPGFEGPLDLLLDLARRQKVDLHEISILALVDQYLAFVEGARAIRFELAADYLVMAAWLAFLKSRLLLPEPPRPEEPPAEELAAALARRLRQLDAIRGAARTLAERPQLGRDVFASAFATEGPDADPAVPLSLAATLHDLLDAYARGRRRMTGAPAAFVVRRRTWSLAEARAALEALVGEIGDWFALERHLVRYLGHSDEPGSVVACLFSAALEMAREGGASLRQDEAFGPLWIGRPDAAGAGGSA